MQRREAVEKFIRFLLACLSFQTSKLSRWLIWMGCHSFRSSIAWIFQMSVWIMMGLDFVCIGYDCMSIPFH